MKHQALFSLKDKTKKFKCRLLQFLFGALRVKMYGYTPVFSTMFTKENNFCGILFVSLDDVALTKSRGQLF